MRPFEFECVAEGTRLEDSIRRFFHEWKTPEARQILEDSGISERNWSLFMRRSGLADGTVWTYERLANEYGISRPRAYQLVKSTGKRLAQYCGRKSLHGSPS